MQHFSSVRLALMAVSAALLLSACAVQQGGHPALGETDSSSSSGPIRDPLIDAPNRALMTCTSEQTVTILTRLGEIPFACPDHGVSATLNDLRDAGWRLLKLDIGEDTESENHVGFPVTIQVRKLF